MHVFGGKPDSRLYVHLMWKASSKYACFTPSTLQLGDYGHVDRYSGEFIREDNILSKHPELKEELANPRETPEDYRIFKNSYKHRSYKELDAKVVAAQLAGAKVKAGWTFDKDRFAALVLVDPVLVEISYEGELYKVLTKDKELRDKALVTQLFKCTTYAILLTNGEKGEATAAFRATAPIPVTVPVTAGGGGKVGWNTNCQGGAWSTGIYEAGVYRYTPLCTLRSIRPKEWGKIRGVPKFQDTENSDVMLEYYPPWNDLEEDGSEIPDEDETYDSSIDSSDEEDKNGPFADMKEVRV